MKFNSKALIVKLSVSDVLASKKFYETTLGFKVDDKYTLNSDGKYGNESYMQLYLNAESENYFMLGLFKDIDAPFSPLPETGSVPSFIVENIQATLDYFIAQKVVIDKIGGEMILSNTSDQGYVDKFFFFRDPDNNSLVIRENILK